MTPDQLRIPHSAFRTTLFLLPALIAVLNLLPAGRVTAQTFTTLHSFTATDSHGYGYNSDGAYPQAGLIVSGNTLYGTATYGGAEAAGTVFAVHTDGTGFTNLCSFQKTDWINISYVCNGADCVTVCGDDGGQCVAGVSHNYCECYNYRDGAYPKAGLTLSGNTLYGTTSGGGFVLSAYNNGGTVFSVYADGSSFTSLYSFGGGGQTRGDRGWPQAGLTLSGNTLYGTTVLTGLAGNGTVFAANGDGTSFTNLHSFTGGNDGAFPYAGLTTNSSGNTLYGTASGGGSSGHGTVFALNTDGTGFTNLHSFTGAGDGGGPQAGLILSGNTLYGTAGGGSGNAGTLFAVHTDGTGFTNLYSFTPTHTNSSGTFTNSDGAYPSAGLILSGNTLYGTASAGGSSGRGTAFAVNTDGVGFTNMHSFTALPPPYYSTNSDGAYPSAGLILSGNTLYGTALQGGPSGNGTVFSISFRPQLTLTPSGIPPSGIILSWPTNIVGFDYTGYTLQSTTNLVPPAVWSTNSPAPVVADGQNTVTNPITGAQQFFRLIQ